MFGIYLSHRKQVNSTCLFIVNLSFSARKWLKTKPRITLVLEWALSTCCFASLGYISFLHRYICILNFVQYGWRSVTVISTLNLTCALSLAGRKTPTRNIPTKPKPQNIGRGQWLCRQNHHHTCLKAHKWWLSWIILI